MKIEILGTGCTKCNLLTENTRTAVANLGVSADITKITDIVGITERGVMMTPALLVDGKVMAVGKVPTVAEIEKMLA